MGDLRKFGPYKLQKHFETVTVPRQIREYLDIETGDNLFWVIDDDGRVVLKKARVRIEFE